jgi:hypothetical protein
MLDKMFCSDTRSTTYNFAVALILVHKYMSMMDAYFAIFILIFCCMNALDIILSTLKIIMGNVQLNIN